MEEDRGAFVADCVVLSCCCQCLVLQVTTFVFFKEDVVKEERWYGNGVVFEEGSSRSDCIEVTEGMLQELSMSKEFGFGSFWRHEDLLTL
ncbi:hypothetical protein Bca52824_080624 [Brassica carinata]|uniref:Uncharacterized protein n=1 Tax=Brassica carinata TaxID=52824 RepID=A0A8X7PH20_BRACI|nr:hypothetical protein Bca52824_080624 [Brassica carinata]